MLAQGWFSTVHEMRARFNILRFFEKTGWKKLFFLVLYILMRWVWFFEGTCEDLYFYLRVSLSCCSFVSFGKILFRWLTRRPQFLFELKNIEGLFRVLKVRVLINILMSPGIKKQTFFVVFLHNDFILCFHRLVRLVFFLVLFFMRWKLVIWLTVDVVLCFKNDLLFSFI
jgi:hypothetical protein